MQASTASSPQPHLSFLDDYLRCMVVEIRDEPPRKILSCRCRQPKELTIRLEEPWLDSQINNGDIVHVFGTPTEVDGRLCIDVTLRNGFLVHKPDELIAVKDIVRAYWCLRRGYLSAHGRSPKRPQSGGSFHCTPETTPNQVRGQLTHNVVEDAFLSGKFDALSISGHIEKALSRARDALLAVDIASHEARQALRAQPAQLERFCQTYVSDHPQSDAVLSNSPRNSRTRIAITGSCAVEQDILSGRLGLKGTVDVVVKTATQESGVITTAIQALEVKTGSELPDKCPPGTQMQALLYSLLVAERFKTDALSALVLCVKEAGGDGVGPKAGDTALFLVPISQYTRYSLCQIFAVRNRLVAYVANRTLGAGEITYRLPPPILDPKSCAQCSWKDTCMLQWKAVENLLPPMDSALLQIWSETTSHLAPQTSDLYRKLLHCIVKEELEPGHWTRPPSQAVRLPALSVIDSPSQTSTDAGRPSYTYTLRGASDPLPTGVVLETGDEVALLRRGFLPLAHGTVMTFNRDSITVAMDNRMPDTSGLFDIEKQPFTSSYHVMRRNLTHFFSAAGDAHLRELIVDLRRPRFRDAELALNPKPPAHLSRAVSHIMRAEDYTLVVDDSGPLHSMPRILRHLLDHGRSVLLIAFRNSDIDDILQQLGEVDVDTTLRLGRALQVNEKARKYLPDEKWRAAGSDAAYDACLARTRLVLSTPLSLQHAVMTRVAKSVKFDVCMVAMCDLMCLPLVLGCIRLAKTFALFGARDERPGAEYMSLFQRLLHEHSEAAFRICSPRPEDEDDAPSHKREASPHVGGEEQQAFAGGPVDKKRRLQYPQLSNAGNTAEDNTARLRDSDDQATNDRTLAW